MAPAQPHSTEIDTLKQGDVWNEGGMNQTPDVGGAVHPSHAPFAMPGALESCAPG
jgi:hypothetical protein